MGALVGENNHGVSRSLYCKDPDGIEFEVMWEVPLELLEADAPSNVPLDLAADMTKSGANRDQIGTQNGTRSGPKMKPNRDAERDTERAPNGARAWPKVPQTEPQMTSNVIKCHPESSYVIICCFGGGGCTGPVWGPFGTCLAFRFGPILGPDWIPFGLPF